MYLISKEKDLILISFITGVFIYYRNIDYYYVFPKENIITSIIIFIWTYLSMTYHWFIIVGLVIANIIDRYKLI